VDSSELGSEDWLCTFTD